MMSVHRLLRKLDKWAARQKDNGQTSAEVLEQAAATIRELQRQLLLLRAERAYDTRRVTETKRRNDVGQAQNIHKRDV